MNIREYQNYVKQGASEKYDKKLSIIGLMGEVGELADVIKKEAIYEDVSKFESKYGMSIEKKVVDEAGDVFWQFVNVLNQYNVSVNDIINMNVKKLNDRHGSSSLSKDGGKR